MPPHYDYSLICSRFCSSFPSMGTPALAARELRFLFSFFFPSESIMTKITYLANRAPARSFPWCQYTSRKEPLATFSPQLRKSSPWCVPCFLRLANVSRGTSLRLLWLPGSSEPSFKSDCGFFAFRRTPLSSSKPPVLSSLYYGPYLFRTDLDQSWSEKYNMSHK